MTIQEIREKIAQTIAGQGSMVDIGGGLPGILNSILDAVEGGGSVKPVIVEGTIDADSGNFTPKAGQPSFGDALNAFQSGVPVFFVYDDANSDVLKTELVMDYGVVGGGDTFSLATSSANWNVNSY